ncbi:Viral alkaline exonuclease [Popillia japonica]
MDYIKRDECFNSAEIRGAKAAMVSRQEYGDSAIGYVEVKREGPQCIVQCKICPEHRIRSKNYVVCLTVDEANESIVSVECKDCAAAAGGCKHALAFLMWMHRRTEEPSPTEVTSYWKKPRLSSVGTSLKFITASGFIKKTVNPPICDISSFRNELTSVGESSNLTGHLIKYASATYEDAFEKLSLYKLMLRFRNIGGIECDEFIKFAATQMNNSLCTEAEKRTRAQSIAPLWHELRYGRITASKLFEIAHCKTPEGRYGRITASKLFEIAHCKTPEGYFS